MPLKPVHPTPPHPNPPLPTPPPLQPPAWFERANGATYLPLKKKCYGETEWQSASGSTFDQRLAESYDYGATPSSAYMTCKFTGTPPPPPAVGCYSGDGASYTGGASVTVSGRTCKQWKDGATKYRHLPANYCRNPDGETAPWCYLYATWERCSQIPQCTASAVSLVDMALSTPASTSSEAFGSVAGQAVNGQSNGGSFDNHPMPGDKVQQGVGTPTILQALDAQDFTTQPPPSTRVDHSRLEFQVLEMLMHGMDHDVAKVKTVMLDLGIGHGEAVTHEDWKGALAQRAAAHLAKHKGATQAAGAASTTQG